MNDWRQEVRDCYEDSPEAANGFIAEVERHIDDYHTLEGAYERHQDRKDTLAAVRAIRDQAGVLAELLELAHPAVISWLRQGVIIAEAEAIQWPEIAGLAEKLRGLVAGADAMVADTAGDPAVQRRGWGKAHPRWEFIGAVRDAYNWYFDEPAEAANLEFASIMTSILGSMGIPHANLARLLKDSDPTR